ncbi:MAG: acyl-CoA dehydrogenase [Myxococcota bacterium]|nr:acyl-CoA dehydrogenase [Myxococcota bacterium]
MTVVGIVATLALFLGLLFERRAYWAWVASGGLLLVGWAFAGSASWAVLSGVGAVFAVLALLFGRREWRSRWVTPVVMTQVGRLLPRLGETERIALEAGTVWWDKELFSGAPDWRVLFDFEPQPLSERELAFLEGPVEGLCRSLNEWDVAQSGDLPNETWEFLKQERFLGMIIPEEYGGLGFSAHAHSAVVQKLSSRSITAAVTVMVPNSLGPAELLLHYGTDAQRDHYLPRLARGEEIPCFALTGPEAGSDAAATQCEGIVCRAEYGGEEVLGMRLNWRKRYITLASVATLIGLAFRLRDPDRLLGDETDRGITCALIPAHLPGIEIGARHDPMGIPFHNGPIVGHDVFVPLDFIIGGLEGAGQGWRMLMESLAAGRSISLPSLSVGGAKLATRVVSAYAMVREQFDTPIGRFEGVEEPLARIAGLTYLMDATRSLTAASVDAGEKPSVLSAIAKAYLTESLRTVTNDAMDIRAGAAIQRGPRNLLGRVYDAVPVGITVEGANILTRSMIIYGQGAIRCHPFALEEIHAFEKRDRDAFDRAFFGHVNHVFSTAARAFLLGVSGGRFERAAPKGPVRRPVQRLSRLSAAFALVSDAAMASLGGQLKRREMITGRLADALAWMYLASATLKRFHDAGHPSGDEPFVAWACNHALAEVESALDGVLRNLPARPLAWMLRPLVLPLGRRERGPDDAGVSAVATAVLDDAETRERLTAGIFVPPEEEIGLGRLEAALRKASEALRIEAKLRAAVRQGVIDRAPGDAMASAGLAAGVISESELAALNAADAARDEVIQVDAFDAVEYQKLRR